MPKVAITEQYLEDIADAIREKTGVSTSYYPSEMAPAILTISGGGITPTGTINITQNGTHNVTSYAYADVQVPTSGDTPVIDSLSVTPTEAEQTFNSSDVDGYKPVTVGAISSDYVGSNIARRSSTNLTVSGDTVTAPAGYYASSASKAVASGTAGTPTASKGTVSNHSISVTPSVTNTTGYITGGTKTGTAVTVSASELVSGSETKTSNGTYDVTNLAELVVNVSGGGSPTIQSLSVTPTESEQTFNSSSVDGYKPVTVGAISSTYVGSGITRRDSTDLTASGATVSVPAGYYEEASSKSVASGSATGPSSLSGSSATITTGTNTITLTKTGVSTTPTVSAGYVSSATSSTATVALTASATVNPTPTASGKTVTIPAGYYSTQTTKDVDTMTLPTSASASATSGYTSKATISRSTSNQYINIPTGYNTAGGYYKINAVANGSATNSGSVSGSSATVSTGTNTITLTKSVSITPSVVSGYISEGTAGNVSVALTASVTTKAAETITPGTTNQTIASGTYLTGTQTIAGDADLVGSNILSTANIFGVQGTVVVQNYYTGSSTPSSSLGSNGDLYLQS